MKAYTLAPNFSSLPPGRLIDIPKCHNIGSAFSFWSVTKSQNKLVVITIKTVVISCREPLAYLQSQENQVNSFECKVHPVGLRDPPG